MPEAIANDPWAQWLRLIHQKAVSDVASLSISAITSEIGSDPDLTLHMPINMQDTDDDTLKWKIVQVIEWGWKYEKDGLVKVISPSKIVVWS
jgi:molecular chaperone GrpE (heat shock protein)